MVTESAPSAKGTPAGHKRVAAAVRLAYLAALIGVVVWLVTSRGDEALELLRQARPLVLLAALVATFGLLVLTARFWVLSLRMLGHHAPLQQVTSVTARALPARYVPAGVTYPAARVALLRGTGLPLAPLTVTAVLEMVLRPAVALTFGTALLAASGALTGGLIWAGVVLAVATVAVSPALGGRLLGHIAARRGVELNITWGGLARLAGTEAIYWAWAAATFLLYLRAFPSADSFGVLHIAGAFMVAWALGFLAVFAPQGIGVAELSLVGLLAVDASENTSLSLAFVIGGYRLAQLTRDAIAAATAEFIAKRKDRRISAQTG